MNPQVAMMLLDVAHMAFEAYRTHQTAGTEPTLAELASINDRMTAAISAHAEAMRAKIAAQVSG